MKTTNVHRIALLFNANKIEHWQREGIIANFDDPAVAAALSRTGGGGGRFVCLRRRVPARQSLET